MTTGAVFSEPVGGDPTAIVSQICGLVKQAPSGSSIRIAHFVISGDSGLDFAGELIAARERGVQVQLVLDGWQVDNPAVDSLRAALGEDETQSSWLHVCSRRSPEGDTASCIGTKGNHNKFYLFSSTGGQSDVVVQSSANNTDLNSTSYWNNAVTLVGNTRLYEAYNAYFADLAAERATDDYAHVTETAMPGGGSVTAYFHPFAERDPILEFLSGANCATPTTIRVGMSEWDDYRIGIAQRLAELAAQGCRVDIVHGQLEEGVLETLSAQPGITRHVLEGSTDAGRIHSKYLILEGGYDGDTDARWVLTGSPNFNKTSLRRNDEAMIKTDLRPVYDRFTANFATMVAAAG